MQSSLFIAVEAGDAFQTWAQISKKKLQRGQLADGDLVGTPRTCKANHDRRQALGYPEQQLKSFVHIQVQVQITFGAFLSKLVLAGV